MPKFYISFADECSSEFLGACVVESDDELSAKKRATTLGIKPGGNAIVLRWPDGDACPFPINQLLTRADLRNSNPEASREAGAGN